MHKVPAYEVNACETHSGNLAPIHFTLQISPARSWCCGRVVVENGAPEPFRQLGKMDIDGSRGLFNSVLRDRLRDSGQCLVKALLAVQKIHNPRADRYSTVE